MNAIRQIQRVRSGQVTIQLPADFEAHQVEIIILPLDEKNDGAQNLRDLLLTAPTLTDGELDTYSQVRGWMSQWNVNAF